MVAFISAAFDRRAECIASRSSSSPGALVLFRFDGIERVVARQRVLAGWFRGTAAPCLAGRAITVQKIHDLLTDTRDRHMPPTARPPVDTRIQHELCSLLRSITEIANLDPAKGVAEYFFAATDRSFVGYRYGLPRGAGFQSVLSGTSSPCSRSACWASAPSYPGWRDQHRGDA